MFRSLMLRQYKAVGVRQFSSGSGMTTVGVVGMGLMGHGIAQLACEKFKVVACDTNEKALNKGKDAIEKSLSKVLGKKIEDQTKVKSEVDKRLANIKGTTKIEDLAKCDIVIEAIIENLDIKKGFYKDLGKIVGKKTILASNTSSFPIGELAVASGCADRVVGLHFFNPVQMMKLVEVVKTKDTSADVFNKTYELVKELDRVPVECKDTPGFVVNRLLVPYIAQAIALLDRGDAKKEDIDTAMKLGAGHPMGPIALADYVGLDTTLAILEGWKLKYPNEAAFVIPKSLKENVVAGKMGRKSGEGYYKWDGAKIIA